MAVSDIMVKASKGRVDYNTVNYCCTLKYPKSFLYCLECNRKLRFKPFNKARNIYFRGLHDLSHNTCW